MFKAASRHHCFLLVTPCQRQLPWQLLTHGSQEAGVEWASLTQEAQWRQQPSLDAGFAASPQRFVFWEEGTVSTELPSP